MTAITIDTSELGFHWREGIFFKRLPNGDVQMTIVEQGFEVDTGRFPDGDDPWWHVVIPAAEWVSIVAAVSVAGSTSESYAHVSQGHIADRGDGTSHEHGAPKT